MGERMRESRRRTTGWAVLAALLALGCCMLAPALSQAKPPAVDEYTLDFPHAGGDGHTGASAGDPGADPSALAPDVRAQLSNPGDAPLVAIATDPSLGAVNAAGGSADSKGGAGQRFDPGERGLFTAAAGALTDGSVLPLILALVAIVGFTIFAARRRSQAG